MADALAQQTLAGRVGRQHTHKRKIGGVLPAFSRSRPFFYPRRLYIRVALSYSWLMCLGALRKAAALAAFHALGGPMTPPSTA